jgi:hypothetical protein
MKRVMRANEVKRQSRKEVFSNLNIAETRTVRVGLVK